MIRVLLAEDHETVREGLRLLVDAQPDMKVVAEAADGISAVRRASEVKPSAIVIDLNMPKMNGLSATRKLRDCAPDSAVIVLTRHSDTAYVNELFEAGAHAYVLKQSSSNVLLQAIRNAVSNRRYIDPVLERELQAAAVNKPRGPGHPSVTERERDVLRRMALGHSNKEIAAALEISIKTVEVHKANGMRKLNLGGRADVIRYAVHHGWLQDP